jgi:uncharacterized phiE125 gp8 family phage protein
MRFSLSPVDPLDGEAVLPLAFAKAHLRVQHDFEDELISVMRDAAVSAVEQQTGKSLAPRSYRWQGRFSDRLAMGVGPIVSVDQIQYIDGAGTEQTPAIVDFARIALNEQLAPVTSPWPATADGEGVVEITFTAGYAVGLIPADLVQAARLTLATFYANRESVVVGVSVDELPLGFVRLCAPYRTMRV